VHSPPSPLYIIIIMTLLPGSYSGNDHLCLYICSFSVHPLLLSLLSRSWLLGSPPSFHTAVDGEKVDAHLVTPF
jgi:hypothetical protein